MLLEKIAAVISMFALVLFMGWVNIRVMEPDLWLVTIVVLGVAVLYFYEEIVTGGSDLKTNNIDDNTEN